MLRLKLIGPLLAAAFLGACAGLPGPAPISDFSSFEGSLEGWTARGIDLTVGGREVAWSIEPSTTTATHGTGSARLYLENFTDAGKIWLEKAFSVRPNSRLCCQLIMAPELDGLHVTLAPGTE